MELYELKLKQFVEVKLMRINKPVFSSSSLPLFGSYNNILNLEQLENDSSSMLSNKFKDFSLNDSSSVSIDNMFQISNTFGKVLFCENLEALLIISNTSDKSIKIKDLKVKVFNEELEGFESLFKKCEFPLITSSNSVQINAHSFYNHKVKLTADIMCKYNLEVEIQYTCNYFNEEYLQHSSNKTIKMLTSNYFIETGTFQVVQKYYKKFIFATMLPFRIKDKFVNDSLGNTFIEVNVINQSPYNLNLKDAGLLLLASTSESNNLNVENADIIKCVSDEETFKDINLEPDEEINIVYLIDNYKAFLLFVNLYIKYYKNSFSFKICWNNSFDSLLKSTNLVFKNRLINELFTLTIIEKPASTIVKGQYFKLILQVTNKTNSKIIFFIIRNNAA